MAMFGIGVWQCADWSRTLKIGGMLLCAYGVIGICFPPMHQREVLAAGGGTITDKLHIVFTIASVLLMVLAMSFSAASLGASFKRYSIVTIALMFVFGMLTASDADRSN